MDGDVPPIIVAVMGPNGVRSREPRGRRRADERMQVGKTTLVRSLVRRYTKNTMGDIKGPVTVVTGQSALSPPAQSLTRVTQARIVD